MLKPRQKPRQKSIDNFIGRTFKYKDNIKPNDTLYRIEKSKHIKDNYSIHWNSISGKETYTDYSKERVSMLIKNKEWILI